MGNSNSSHSDKRTQYNALLSTVSESERTWLHCLIRQVNAKSIRDLLPLLAVATVQPPAADNHRDPHALVSQVLDSAIQHAQQKVMQWDTHHTTPEDHIVVLVCALLADITSHLTTLSPEQQSLILSALWLPISRTLAGVYMPAPPPPPPLPPIALRAKSQQTASAPVPDPLPSIAFAPTHCAPKKSLALPASCALPTPPTGTSFRTLLSLYWLRPYLLTSPTPLPSCLLSDRQAGLLLPHLGGTLARPLLQPQHILALAHALPPPLRTCWRQAYASVRDGRAWSALHRGVMQTVVEHLASWALVLVIKDTRGTVFGAVMTEVPLIPGPKFRNERAIGGTSGSAGIVPSEVGGMDLVPFVFSVSPTAGVQVYRPTGINANQLYINAGSATLPNGIGFGGQLDFFGLWLDASMDSGHSRVAGDTSLTFGNPVLASSPEFDVANVEAWVVECAGWERDPEAEVVPGADGKKSVLDQFPELVEMMEMAGRKMYSKELPQVPVDWDDLE